MFISSHRASKEEYSSRSFMLMTLRSIIGSFGRFIRICMIYEFTVYDLWCDWVIYLFAIA